MLNKRFFAGFFALTTILVSAPSVSANSAKEMRVLTAKETHVLIAQNSFSVIVPTAVSEYYHIPYGWVKKGVDYGEKSVPVPIINKFGKYTGKFFNWPINWRTAIIIDYTMNHTDNYGKEDKNRTKRDFQRINSSTKNKETAFIKE